MIEEEAFVAEVSGGHVWLEKTRKPACSGCAETCANSFAGKFFTERTSRFPVSSPLDLSPGDRVVVGIAEGALVHGSFGVYLLPLFALFVGALTGKAVAELSGWLTSEFGGVLGGISGLLLCLAGLKVSRFLDRTGLQPVILRKIN